jgi:hypothetical protein
MGLSTGTLAVTAVAGFDWLCKSDLATATSVHRFVRRALLRASLLVALVEHVNLGSKSAGPKSSIKPQVYHPAKVCATFCKRIGPCCRACLFGAVIADAIAVDVL